jgi:hypothetical protein
MLKIRALALTSVFITLFIGAPRQQVSAGAPQFSSSYTDLNRECKNAFKESEINEGSDMPLRCKGYGSYYVYIWYSAWASQIAVQMKGNEDVSIFLAMQELGYSDAKGRKIEWRMADGKPFAVIARISNYSDKAGADGGNPFDPKYKTGESLIVKGLKGYEYIDGTIDAKTPDANARARQLADEKYQKQ